MILENQENYFLMNMDGIPYAILNSMKKLYTSLHSTETSYLAEQVSLAPEGPVVCIGTWRGGDIMEMIKTNPNRHYVAIDSFHGLSAPTKEDGKEIYHIQKNKFSIKGKANFLKGFEENKIRPPDEIYEVWIDPETIRTINIDKIGLLWIDLDLYSPIKTALEYFAPKVIDKNFIYVHDYFLSITPGVKKACLEFDSSDHWERVCGGIVRYIDE
jgi:hypothetical protein